MFLKYFRIIFNWEILKEKIDYDNLSQNKNEELRLKYDNDDIFTMQKGTKKLCYSEGNYILLPHGCRQMNNERYCITEDRNFQVLFRDNEISKKIISFGLRCG